MAGNIKSWLKKFSLRRWITWGLVALIVVCVVAWFVTREVLPREIRIATATKGGFYYKFASALKPHLERRTGRSVALLETKGSVQNRELLLAGKAHLAIMQAGAFPMDGLSALAPLYPDVVHVIARQGRGIASIRDLAGKSVSLGRRGSGNRNSALLILEHYDVDPEKLEQNETYFKDLLDDELDVPLDAAIVTTGLLNPDLHTILKTGRFELIPILDAKALAIRHAYFSPIDIPRGLFKEGPPVPAKPVPTVATVAILAARDDVPDVLVTKTLSALYSGEMRLAVPTMMSLKEAAAWQLFPLHDAARGYYNPYEGLGLLTNFMESLAATKELLFAFGAAFYLLWVRRQRKKEEREKADFAKQKEHLDRFLDETVRIEREQMASEDPRKLKDYLNEVTEIKLRALDELTDEALRGDRLFSIFLMQCSNLTRKIQMKISLHSRTKGD